ncbi:IS200/IS605 family accessory protein TnpB-related protein [Oceanobacillus sp. J11TS1]|uniref:IS200/IS605 family accessory protein TnpB-related protein n=1 Tax=Oceanobacillus sp. J11TS1 TaxID=2807191 RepID=UPI001B05E92F|nr:IS200/IS605 family accessory protein TnpB-related protein [Oceanobacillus sp. J11TS1]GIO23290.1 hypothetical protein J11TS1_18710 [Oceanobacillus sp. J11TS1]
MAMRAFFSNRIYKNTLLSSMVLAIGDTLRQFNRAKQFAFDKMVKEKRSGEQRRNKSLHLLVKQQFQLDDYYTNSAIQAAKAQIKSLEELKTLYITDTKAQISTIKKKIKKERSKLTSLKKIKKSFIQDKPKFPKNAREQKKGHYYTVSYKNYTEIYPHAYAFEHLYLDPKIKGIQHKLGLLTSRLNLKEEALRQLKSRIPSAVFGTRKYFKAQRTKACYTDDHDAWLEGWRKSRYSKMTLSGRKDAAYGNFVFQYNPDNHLLHMKTPIGQVRLENVVFAYGQEIIDEAIQTQRACKDKKKHGKPIAWSLEDHGMYYIVKCLVDVAPNPHTNYAKSSGIIGVDLNVDHFAVSNMNEKGQLVASCTIPFDLEKKTTGQAVKIIEAAAIQVVDIAHAEKKPIAMEKLAISPSKVINPYGNKKANRKISMFAYRKMVQAIKARAEKIGVAVFEVNPAFTSQIGKMKYMKRFGISIHEAASFVIARRAMGFKEKLPPVLRALLPEKMIGAHHWAQWKYVSQHLKEIRIHAFYLSELFDVDRFDQTGECFVAGALTGMEQNSLSKLKSRKPIS